ncbi:MAG: serine/threonine-protein kinase [Blastocatellia bacterium]
MEPEQWQQIERLYHAALERAPAARAAFLAEACANDAALRREVEELLQYDDEAETFMQNNAAVAVAQQLDSEELQATQTLLTGQQLGAYKILVPLGKGGIGEVFLALDTRLERKVALKLLPRDVAANPERLRRFVREAKAASALNHPHVATVYDIGAADGVSFIVMEYVEGQTLAAKISGAPLPIEVVAIGSQIADALDEAHSKGITHRDLKPANVMLNERGQVKVLDFGLTKISRPPSIESNVSTLKQTTPGIVMGTVPYMSPEQVLGREVDHRSDIFSLGVVLYEMATGKLPFAGANTVETLDRILHAEPQALTQCNADAPADLERIVRRCLAKELDVRYQAAAVMGELQALLTSSPVMQSAESPTREMKAVATDESDAANARFAFWRWLAVGALAVLLLLGAFLFWRHTPTVQPNQIHSLVVLPLENLSGDSGQEYFADGMTDALIGDLAKIGALRVISRTSACTTRGRRSRCRKSPVTCR